MHNQESAGVAHLRNGPEALRSPEHDHRYLIYDGDEHDSLDSTGPEVFIS
jgi:hypothetical protein